MDLTIVGAGAVGGLIGAHLARTGHRVLLVDRDLEHVEAILRGGLRITGASEFTVRVPACLPHEVRAPVRTLLLAVKALHTLEALEPLAPLLTPDGCVVSMQNGLEESRIAGIVGARRTVGAFLTFGGYHDGPGRIVYSGPASLRVGELDGTITPRVSQLARALSDFHPCEVTDNIHGFLWGKLILGTIYFATATVDADVVEILGRPRYRRALEALATEACDIARALGIRVEPVDGFDPRAVWLDASGQVADPHAADAAWAAQAAYWNRGLATRTGVWRDLAVRRRRTEAGPILGALLDAAASAGRPAPRVRTLIRIIAELEDGQRIMTWKNLDEVARATA